MVLSVQVSQPGHSLCSNMKSPEDSLHIQTLELPLGSSNLETRGWVAGAEAQELGLSSQHPEIEMREPRDGLLPVTVMNIDSRVSIGPMDHT